MALNVENMVDITMSAALNVIELEQSLGIGTFEELQRQCALIEQFFGFNTQDMPTLRAHVLKKLLRDGYPPLNGEHHDHYDPYPRARRDFEQLVQYANGGGDHHVARDFCLMLNRILLGTFASHGNRRYLVA